MRSETFLIVLDGVYEGHLAVFEIMVVHAIKVHPKMYLIPIGLVDVNMLLPSSSSYVTLNLLWTNFRDKN